MAAASDTTASQLFDEQFERLAGFEPAPFPFINLYLNTQRDERGRGRLR